MVAEPQVERDTLGSVIVASDDVDVRRTVLECLALDGPLTVAARPVEQARQFIETVDVVLLDIRACSAAVLSEFRAKSRAQLLVITGGRWAESDAVAHGADDVIAWPCPADELAWRMRAAVNRLRGIRSQRNSIEGPQGIRINPRGHEAWVNDVEVALTPKEFQVLLLLLERRGEVLTADDLSSVLWGHQTFGARNFVEAHVSRLRQKLKAAGVTDLITTIRGVGYKIR